MLVVTHTVTVNSTAIVIIFNSIVDIMQQEKKKKIYNSRYEYFGCYINV